ncbi:MAG TPA: 4-hydroxythreonine-4-phosphate dehydrogenase PdxA [Candidatus Wallbacteria bacterium]|nr:4-hydroxythreonine-4-phosphate dehydrogenase PdxA [Candidatus Wallbacteria bacterium]
MSEFKTIGITMGDPAGIGPKICLLALREVLSGRLKRGAGFVIFGNYDMLSRLDRELGTGLCPEKVSGSDRGNILSKNGSRVMICDIDSPGFSDIVPGRASAESGAASFEYIKKACSEAMEKKIDAIVTAPISKEAINLSGHKWPGHTEMMSYLSGSRNVEMAFVGDKMRLVLATRHLSLADSVKELTAKRVRESISCAAALMDSLYPRSKSVRIMVAGLNPHAGEKGLFGKEEEAVINPAIIKMRDHFKSFASGRKISIEGPIPADTLFHAALREHKGTVIVALYHDQGLIPFKLLYFESGVNVTIGLPFVRTSPDHGTAYDKARGGECNFVSMKNAIELAASMRKVEPDNLFIE